MHALSNMIANQHVYAMHKSSSHETWNLILTTHEKKSLKLVLAWPRLQCHVDSNGIPIGNRSFDSS